MVGNDHSSLTHLGEVDSSPQKISKDDHREMKRESPTLVLLEQRVTGGSHTSGASDADGGGHDVKDRNLTTSLGVVCVQSCQRQRMLVCVLATYGCFVVWYRMVHLWAYQWASLILLPNHRLRLRRLSLPNTLISVAHRTATIQETYQVSTLRYKATINLFLSN